MTHTTIQKELTLMLNFRHILTFSLFVFQDSQNGLSLGSAGGQSMYGDDEELQKQMANMALGMFRMSFLFFLKSSAFYFNISVYAANGVAVAKNV